MVNLLIDLDGTLTDTNGDEFDDIKYGRNRQFGLQEIPLIQGAADFIQQVKNLGHSVTIVSDSHHAYVERMAEEVFDVLCVSLTEKPNTKRLRAFLLEHFNFLNDTSADDFLFIGDTKFDIRVARSLEIPSVCLDFSYRSKSNNSEANKEIIYKLKEGATYYCKNYQDVLGVLENPAARRFVLEDKAGQQVAKFWDERNRNNGYTMFRSLARQQQGLCDKFGTSKRYHDFQSAMRSTEFVSEIAEDVSRYLRDRVCAYPDKFSWDYITCVPDKKTTTPPNKMEEFLSALDVPIPKDQLFLWPPDTDGSIRDKKNRKERLTFADKLILVQKEHSLKDKNVIVLDDQYTTGATAENLSKKLLDAGVQNVLFLCLFYLANDVPPEMKCPKCQEATRIEYNKKKRNFFFACVSYRDKNAKCRWTETIK